MINKKLLQAFLIIALGLGSSSAWAASDQPVVGQEEADRKCAEAMSRVEKK